jgi:energy-converting hydrogenase Eha subunit E
MFSAGVDENPDPNMRMVSPYFQILGKMESILGCAKDRVVVKILQIRINFVGVLNLNITFWVFF